MADLAPQIAAYLLERPFDPRASDEAALTMWADTMAAFPTSTHEERGRAYGIAQELLRQQAAELDAERIALARGDTSLSDPERVRAARELVAARRGQHGRTARGGE